MRFPVSEHPWGRLDPAIVRPLADAERKRLGLPSADKEDMEILLPRWARARTKPRAALRMTATRGIEKVEL